jgi:siderophore synthetase component
MMKYGIAFEAHPQNCVARFSLTAPYKLLGFIFRDLGGLRVHLQTLQESTGMMLETKTDGKIIADTLYDVHKRMYHTIFHNHLQQLVRVLGLHYSGKGWDVIRRRVRDIIPQGHPLEQNWLSADAKVIPGKCYLQTMVFGHYVHVSS